jgi:hypothetical protein
MNSDDISPWMARGLYLFGIALMMTAAIDLFTTVWPMRPGEMAWRYGFLGLAAGYLQTPTLGIILIAGVAIWEDNVMVLRVTGVGCLATALVLTGIMGLFGLDLIQIRGLRAEEMQASVLAGGLFQEVKYLVATVTFAFLGHGALKTAKEAGGRPDRVSQRKPGIVSATGSE